MHHEHLNQCEICGRYEHAAAIVRRHGMEVCPACAGKSGAAALAAGPNPLVPLVIRQHRDRNQAYRNAARYGRWLCRRDLYRRARAEGRAIRFPIELVQA